MAQPPESPQTVGRQHDPREGFSRSVPRQLLVRRLIIFLEAAVFAVPTGLLLFVIAVGVFDQQSLFATGNVVWLALLLLLPFGSATALAIVAGRAVVFRRWAYFAAAAIQIVSLVFILALHLTQLNTQTAVFNTGALPLYVLVVPLSVLTLLLTPPARRAVLRRSGAPRVRRPRHPWRWVAGCGSAAVILVALLVAVSGETGQTGHSYTAAQLNQVAEVIGAPPGFQKEATSEEGGGFAIYNVFVTYTGQDSTDDLVAWTVSRLRSLGLAPESFDAGQNGVEVSGGSGEVTTFCGGLNLAFYLNQQDENGAFVIEAWEGGGT